MEVSPHRRIEKLTLLWQGIEDGQGTQNQVYGP